MNGKMFLIVAVVLAAVDVLVPYLLLAQTGSFLASFLFWCLLTALVIVLASFWTRSWRNQ